MNPPSQDLHQSQALSHPWLLIVSAGTIFIIDLMAPRGVAGGIPYVLIVLLSLRHRQTHIPLWTAIGCSALTIAGFYLFPEGKESWDHIVNRIMTLCVIWATIILGQRHDILWNIDRPPDETQEPSGVIGTGHDITDWNKTQVQLQQWTSVFHQTQWGMAVGSANSQTLDMVNEAYARMHGYTVEELQGKSIAQVFATESQKQLPLHIRLIHEHGLHSFEALHVRKDGTTFPALLTISDIKDPRGEVRCRVANVIDISDMKKAEAAFYASEKRFRAYFEAGLVGMAITSPQHQWIEVNDYLCDMLGYTREELAEQSWTDLIHSDDRQTIHDHLQQLITGTIERVLCETRFIRKDRTVLYAKLSAQFVRDSSGEADYLALIIQDISTEKEAQETIRRHNVELEATIRHRTQRIQELEQRRMQVEKLAALAQIAAGVAHEINNPLASISQSLVLLKRAIPHKHPHYRYMAKVEDCIERISQITARLYQLYRPSSPVPSTLDVRIPIQNAIDIMQRPSSKHGVEIVANIQHPLLCRAPRNEMIQVLCNLLQNAIDTSQPHDTIEVITDTESDTITIHVIDHGQGISPDIASHIFEPFFSTKQGQTDGGMGLGLSISHSLVAAMGGTLDFSSTLGQGSRFTITLPGTSENGGSPA